MEYLENRIRHSKEARRIYTRPKPSPIRHPEPIHRIGVGSNFFFLPPRFGLNLKESWAPRRPFRPPLGDEKSI